MTPRIKELILKSGVVHFESDGKIRDAERLVRLVIEECLLALEPDWYGTEIEYEFEQRFFSRCNAIIKKHFGLNIRNNDE